MKFLLMLLTTVIAVSASASGKLSLQGNFYDDKSVKPMVGFGVYEKLFFKSYLNLWTGYGVQPLEIRDDVSWFVAKASVDMRFKKFIVAPGVMYKNLPGENFSDTIPTIRVEYVIW